METLIDDPPRSQDGDEAELSLKNLSDFKELCKSVASLLHIEDKAAAAMLTEPLSGRRDLVEGLDAEAILDYLTQHGVLDADTVQSLRGTASMTQRNAALLQRVEAEGHNAVALFINALRQSGQLHLASSLDNTQRIKPVSGSGYWEKQRYKGQVTIQIKVNKLRIVVPERDTQGDVIDASMLASPQRQHGLDLASQHHHRSYENMQLLDSPDLAMQRSVRINDYPYCVDDEEERPSGKKSFFCFCFPRAAKKKKTKEKKYLEQQELKLKKLSHPGARDNEEALRDVGGVKYDQGKTARSLEKDSPARIGSTRGETGEGTLGGGYHRNSGGQRFGVDLVDQKNTKNERKSHGGSGDRQEDKENTDPVIMEYNKKMELVKLRAQTHKDKAESKADSPVIMCEKWKSGGRYFHKKLRAFCELFESELHTYIIKYFEQDRGTLVLQVWTDGSAMCVYNICLTVDQVRQLQNDFASGVLAKRLDSLLRSSSSLEKLDIKDAEWVVTIDDDQFRQALQDLT